MNESVVDQPYAIETPLIEALQAQIQSQQRTIDQLLERMRDLTVVVNTAQQRQITVQTPAGKTEAEKRRETWIAIACIGVLLLILGLVVWFTWYRI